MGNIFGKIFLTIKKKGKLMAINKEFEKILIDNLKELGKEATGNLIKSIDSSVTLQEESLSFNLRANHYLIYVDEGRKPGTYPNFDSLKKWMTVKGIPQEALFPIANKIKEKGIKPTDVIGHTILDIESSRSAQDLANLLAIELGETLVEQITFKRN
jgi:hypothetical protein